LNPLLKERPENPTILFFSSNEALIARDLRQDFSRFFEGSRK
jgi:hypothetical protein